MRRFTDINESFTCAQCGREVPPSNRSCRNHCPYCLYSMHLDVFPGDRMADCGGLMVPISVTAHSKKGYQLLHRCQKCGAEGRNIINFDDKLAPDSMDEVLRLMRKVL